MVTSTFIFIIVLRIYIVFQYNNPMLQFNTAIQIQHVSSSAHTIQIGWVASPQHAANTSGGSSEAGHFKSSRHHLA
jgi:hypothetical protein